MEQIGVLRNNRDLLAYIFGIDIAATSLSVAGIALPEHIEGQDIFGADFKREFVVAARDRCDAKLAQRRMV